MEASNRRLDFEAALEGKESYKMLIGEHLGWHPEIGAILTSQCGAQAKGCAYDTPERSEKAAPEWLHRILFHSKALWRAGEPGLIAPVLASDGWWWRPV